MIPLALYDKLRDVARKRGTVYYSEIAPIVGIDMDSPHFGTHVGRLLDDINHAEVAAQRPLLSAVVIRKDANIPGAGFFTCARNLMLYAGNDDLAYWLEELRRVHDYWSQH